MYDAFLKNALRKLINWERKNNFNTMVIWHNKYTDKIYLVHRCVVQGINNI